MLHPRAFKVTVVWTLALLFLGSVVHATESSLACPDWPTCYGTMVPEMSGGVFWEHLHRLVAGGLVLMFVLAAWLVRREVSDRPRLFKACLAGIALLLVQSVVGGLTVIYRLPDMLSTTHLSLAFLFLSLATFLAASTHRRTPEESTEISASVAASLRLWAAVGAGLIFLQSAVGALVRHTDGGIACPDFPLCLGQVIPPLINVQITSHFFHRVFALVATVLVIRIALWVMRQELPSIFRKLAWSAVALVVIQVALGIISVLTVLAVPPVSLHTLVAAALLANLVALSTLAGRT